MGNWSSVKRRRLQHFHTVELDPTTAALFDAVKRDSLSDLLKPVASGRATSVDVRNHDGETSLFYAKNVDVAAFLLRNDADVNARNDNETPLFFAVKTDDLRLVKFLLENGADVQTQAVHKKTALHHAASAVAVKLLVEREANVNAPDSGESPPFEVVRLGRLELNMRKESVMFTLTPSTTITILEKLVEHGAQVNVFNNATDTPLHRAAAANSIDLVRFVVEHGVSPNTVSRIRMMPLCVAVSNGNLDIVKYLLENNAFVPGYESLKALALYYTAMNGRLGTMTELVARGASFSSSAEGAEDNQLALNAPAPDTSPAAMVSMMIEHLLSSTLVRQDTAVAVDGVHSPTRNLQFDGLRARDNPSNCDCGQKHQERAEDLQS